jgi:hypothetical protein
MGNLCSIEKNMLYYIINSNKEENLNKFDKYVEYFLNRFKYSFPEESITPKMHFLRHHSK